MCMTRSTFGFGLVSDGKKKSRGQAGRGLIPKLTFSATFKNIAISIVKLLDSVIQQRCSLRTTSGHALLAENVTCPSLSDILTTSL